MSFKDEVLQELYDNEPVSYIDKLAAIEEEKEMEAVREAVIEEMLENEIEKIAFYDEVSELVKEAAEELEDAELYEVANTLENIAIAEADDLTNEEKIASEDDFLTKVAQEAEKIELLGEIGEYFYEYGAETGLDKLAEIGEALYAVAEEEAEILDELVKEAAKGNFYAGYHANADAVAKSIKTLLGGIGKFTKNEAKYIKDQLVGKAEGGVSKAKNYLLHGLKLHGVRAGSDLRAALKTQSELSSEASRLRNLLPTLKQKVEGFKRVSKMSGSRKGLTKQQREARALLNKTQKRLEELASAANKSKKEIAAMKKQLTKNRIRAGVAYGGLGATGYGAYRGVKALTSD